MTCILVRTKFEGIHRWAQAPDEVAFLRDFHRHEFWVDLKIEVFGDDRELEFILVKRSLDSYLTTFKQPMEQSCEMIAKQCISWATQKYGRSRYVSCSVFEDGENGAVVE